MEKEKTITLPAVLTAGASGKIWRSFENLPQDTELTVDFGRVQSMDSSAAALLSLLRRRFIRLETINLGTQEQRMLELMSREQSGAQVDKHVKPGFMARLNTRMLRLGGTVSDSILLVSDSVFHLASYLVRRRGVQPGDVARQIYLMGYKSLPIITVISLLVGLTISLTTAAQLRLLGGDIYLPSIVGFAMIKELVPLMTGIILAGKIGASITAEIGTMKVLEEIDALRTMGVDPVRFLMVPRLLGVSVAVPLLLVCADFIAVFGSILVGNIVSSIPAGLFIKEMLLMVGLSDFMLALLKTMTFGWAVVFSAGAMGFRTSGGAEGVGLATTDSVVMSISMIIVIDCIFALFEYF